MDRRNFLKISGLTLAGTLWNTAGLPPALVRALYAAQSAIPGTSSGTAKKKTLVVIFQRGAADGLSIVPPLGDPHYRAYRPTIALSDTGENAALKLDGFFGLHPALAPLKPFWDSQQLAIIHEAGIPVTTRSHFDAQDYMESGTPGLKATEDGYLNRALHALPSPPSPFRAVALQPTLPRSLRGQVPVLAVNSLKDFSEGGALKNASLALDFESMYRGALDQALHGVGEETFAAMKTLKEVVASDPVSESKYSGSVLGKRLCEIARLIKGDLGLQVAATDIGGWDTHVNEGGATGQLANRLKEFSEAIAAFATDLGPRLDDVVLVTMTEFGRTVRENGNRGTDHGHGSVMFVLGGKVRGKRVIARWKGLAEQNLYEGRDLPLTTDYRDVMLEVFTRHLGMAKTSEIFPGFPRLAQNTPHIFR